MTERGEMVAIATADGTMNAFLARPPHDQKAPGVIVVHEAFGLNTHIKEVATRISDHGHTVLAPDLYYRQPNSVVAYDNLAEALTLMSALADDKIVADMGAAIAYLQQHPNVHADRIAVTGFCMGGRVTFLTACLNPAVRAAVPFYGGGIGNVMQPSERTPKAPLEYAEQLKAPMLLFFGGDDPFIPTDEVEKIESRLAELGKNAEVVVYPGAPHGFFCNERPSYRADAATDAWDRMGKFFEKYL